MLIEDPTKCDDLDRHGTLTWKEIHAKVIVGDPNKLQDPDPRRALVGAEKCSLIAGIGMCGKTWTTIPDLGVS